MYTKKQIDNNSCGAVCLLGAAYDALSAAMVKANLGCNPNDMPNEVEKVIYYVTSGTERDPSQVFDPVTAGYSLPSNICRAAISVGFHNVEVYLDITNPIASILLSKYTKERNDIATSGGTVINNKYDWTTSRQRCLVVIFWNAGGLHYVYAHNGKVMDPGSGTIRSATDFSKSIASKGKVAGIFIVLT